MSISTKEKEGKKKKKKNKSELMVIWAEFDAMG